MSSTAEGGVRKGSCKEQKNVTELIQGVQSSETDITGRQEGQEKL